MTTIELKLLNITQPFCMCVLCEDHTCVKQTYLPTYRVFWAREGKKTKRLGHIIRGSGPGVVRVSLNQPGRTRSGDDAVCTLRVF